MRQLYFELEDKTSIIVEIITGIYDINIIQTLSIDTLHSYVQSLLLNIISLSIFRTMFKGIKTKIIYEGDMDEDLVNQIKFNGIM